MQQRRLLRFVLVLLLVASSAVPLRAQGLVQIALKGAVAEAGGGWCDLSVSALDAQRGELQTGVVALHAAEGTGAGDLVLLLASRLEARGVKVVRPAAPAGPTQQAAHELQWSLFVEQCAGVSLRVPEGLQLSATTSEGAPQSVRLLPASAAGGVLFVRASAHNRADGVVSPLRCQVSLTKAAAKDDIASALAAAAIEAGWRGAVEGRDTWLPGLPLDGTEVRGASFVLSGAAGATLQLGLKRG